MRRLLTLIPIALLVAIGLAACGADGDGSAFFEGATSSTQAGVSVQSDRGSGDDSAFDEEQAFEEAESEAFAEAEEQADFARPSAEPLPAGGEDGVLQVVERRVIQTGFMSIEVGDVQAASAQVQLTAEALGGFVENSSVSGDKDEAFADITIRVPAASFSEALERIRRIGEVRSESLNAQDVTDQFIDLEARLNAATREEASLLDLLGRADDVQDVLIIERELTRIRSDIERVQGQLNFLERRVALSTLSVSLFTPFAARTEPPSASFGLDADDVEDAIAAVEEVAAAVDGLVDASVITISDGEASGFVAIRVPRDDFARAVAAVEELGDIRTKTVRTGERADDPEAAFGDEPDAPIEVRLRQADGGTDAWLIVAIVLPSVLGGLLLVGIVVLLASRGGVARRPGPDGVDDEADSVA